MNQIEMSYKVKFSKSILQFHNWFNQNHLSTHAKLYNKLWINLHKQS